MINSTLNKVLYKRNDQADGFLLVVFDTSMGLFELDNNIFTKVDKLTKGYQVLNNYISKPENLSDIKILKVLFTIDMDFIVILNNKKVVLISANSIFGYFDQTLNVYDIEDLTEDYLDEAEKYIF